MYARIRMCHPRQTTTTSSAHSCIPPPSATQADSMLGARGVLAGARDKVRVVMADRSNRQTLGIVGALASCFLLLWWLVHR